MRQLHFTVPEGLDGVLLKNFLRHSCRVSSGLLTELKRVPNGILRNGIPAVATDALKFGDEIRLTLPEELCGAEPVPRPLSVLLEDEDLLILEKPSGMPMYPCPGHDRDSLENAVSARCSETGEPFAFRPVYRLDRDTTGAVVLAKNRYAAAGLAEKIEKTYIAVCEGILQGSGTIDRPIGLRPGHSVERAVTESGKRAVTRWKSLFSGGGHSVLVLKLGTGRTHQIRVHLASIGHPLAGDDFYGGNRRLIGRQALHCGTVRFVHPVTGESVFLFSPLPEDLSSLFFRLGVSEREFGEEMHNIRYMP